jgi:hypothetical protein
VLDNFYALINDRVEVLTADELTSRNAYIDADVSLEVSLQNLKDWKEDSAPQLEFHRLNRIHVSQKLRKRGLDPLVVSDLRSQQQELDATIADLVRKRKDLEADLSLKRKCATKAKSYLKELREKKKKVETPVLFEIKNILPEFGIMAAAYHGGKLNLNGIDCHELIKLAKTIFECFKACLLSVAHPSRCNDNIIEQACDLHHDICVTLDSLTSKLRMKNSEPQESDYATAKKNLTNLPYLWTQAKLSFTPKIHGLLSRAVKQMRRFQGIGDTLEDDVERIHQISAKNESRISRTKNKGQQAHVHSKMEAIQYCNLVKGIIEESQLSSKRIFKKCNLELCAHEGAKK